MQEGFLPNAHRTIKEIDKSNAKNNTSKTADGLS